ncbi:MAG: flagellar filament capping protein FliD [Pseudomonadota bacterium]
MTTGSISSAGIGSGLDVNSIITSLMAVEKQPLTKLQTVASTMQTKLSAFGQMQSFVSSFRDAAAQLQTASNYAITTATSSDTTAVGATSTTTAIPGSYAVSVTALASTQSTVSASGQFTAGTDAVGTGSITISLGTWSAGQAGFTPKTGSTDVVIPVGASENTLAGIRDKINAANAGVSATLVTDANGARLALQSSATGASNGFRVSVTDDDGNNTDALGLSRLAFDPPSSTVGTTLTQSAVNTKASINGIAVETTGSTLTNVVDGMTFNLGKVTTAPVTVSVTRNTDSVKSLVTGFVASYNALASFLSSATSYDASTKTAALLQGDATTTGLQNQLRSMVGGAGKASAVFGTLSDIGLEFQKDGRLKVNDSKLTAALAKLPELTKAMTNVDLTTPANNGFGKTLTSWADGLLSTNGSLNGKTKSIQSQIASNQKDQDHLNDRLTAIEARIRAQYTALDATMSNANALSKYVTQQITTWNKSTA